MVAVDIDRCEEAVKKKYEPTGIPTHIAYKKGVQVDFYIGPMVIDPQVVDFVNKNQLA